MSVGCVDPPRSASLLSFGGIDFVLGCAEERLEYLAGGGLASLISEGSLDLTVPST